MSVDGRASSCIVDYREVEEQEQAVYFVGK
jgi:hypothetical protein